MFRAKFQRETIFGGATFQERADFVQAKFQQGAYFARDNFQRGVEFIDATFQGDTNFHGVKLEREVDFSNANFQGKSNFSNAKFAGEAVFAGAEFYGLATFIDSQFSDKTYFSGHFNDKTRFNYVLFAGKEKVIFEVENLSNVSFMNTDITGVRFSDKARWGEKKIKEVKFKTVDERLLEEAIKKERW